MFLFGFFVFVVVLAVGFVFYQAEAEEVDVLFGAIVAIAGYLAYFVYHVHAFYYFAEYGIATIQVRCAAYGLVGFALGRCELAAEAHLYHIQLFVCPGFAGNYVELAA